MLDVETDSLKMSLLLVKRLKAREDSRDSSNPVKLLQLTMPFFLVALVAFIHSEERQEIRADMQQRVTGWELNLQSLLQDCSTVVCLHKYLFF